MGYFSVIYEGGGCRVGIDFVKPAGSNEGVNYRPAPPDGFLRTGNSFFLMQRDV